MGVDHGGFEITVPQQFLDRADIVVCLEQVTGKAMTKGMSRCPLADPRLTDCCFDRRLHMRFMEMIPSILPRPRNGGQVLCRKKSLPDKLLNRFRVLPLQSIHQEYPRIIPIQVALM